MLQYHILLVLPLNDSDLISAVHPVSCVDVLFSGRGNFHGDKTRGVALADPPRLVNKANA